ncbi:MAG TPA: hypothetical protein VK645_17665 [Chitinophagaceae bacterium]|nr:hypothetical protein [Chitinophagaceae bacterium]
MKGYLIKISFLFAIILSSFAAVAQEDIIRLENCMNESYKVQIDSLKQLFSNQGYEVVREASVKMESEYELPIVLPLTQGAWYQFIFIGDPTSKLYEVRMYDWNEKEVVYKKHMWGDVDGNIISYPYVSQFTEYHLIKPVQVNKQKKKGLCGYVMLLKKVK